MATRKTAVKRFAALALIAYLAFSGAKLAELGRVKAEALSRWGAVLETARAVSAIVPNYVYLGKTANPPRNDLVTEAARARLDVEVRIPELAAAQGWELDFLPAVATLTEFGSRLAESLPSTPHKRDLDAQWKLRLAAFESARGRFLEEHERLSSGKRSPTGWPMILWDGP
jgi:hypothetical protein